MSHCPGYTLEAYLTYAFDLLVEEHSTAIRAFYAYQKILSPEQFASLVKIFESCREGVESRLDDYMDGGEEDHGSWRDWEDNVHGRVPDEIWKLGREYINSLKVEETKPLLER
jgi:hypothetical protein